MHVTYLWSFLSHASRACRQVSLKTCDMACFSSIPSLALLTRLCRRAHRSWCSCISHEGSGSWERKDLAPDTMHRNACLEAMPGECVHGTSEKRSGCGKKAFWKRGYEKKFAPYPKSRSASLKPSGDP